MGVSHTSIFCSSFKGYGIPLGVNFLEKIKNEINGNTIVLFVLSPNFYNSPVSLCEMGAAWISTKEHVPILIPPFEFDDVKGVFPLSQGMKINDKEGLNELKDSIETFLDIKSVKSSIWERDRNEIYETTEKILSERTKPNAKVINYYNKLSNELSEEDLNILNAIHTNNGEALGMREYLSQTNYGEDIIRNLERLNLIEESDDTDLWGFYHLSLFGLNMMIYLDKKVGKKSKPNSKRKKLEML